MMQLGWYAGERHAGRRNSTARSPTALREQAIDVVKDRGREGAGDPDHRALDRAPSAPARPASVRPSSWRSSSRFSADLAALPTGRSHSSRRSPPTRSTRRACSPTVQEAQRRLEDRWTSRRDEAVAQAGVAGLQQYAEQIRQATTLVESTYYPELVAGYLPLAPGRTARARDAALPSTRARAAGSRHSVGSSHYVSQIRGRDIYVELAASDFVPAQMRIVQTVVPELPSTVLARLNDPAETQGQLLSTASDASSGHRGDHVDRSRERRVRHGIRIVRRALTHRTSRGSSAGASGSSMAGRRASITRAARVRSPSMQFAGAVGLYGTILSKPLSAMQFQA